LVVHYENINDIKKVAEAVKLWENERPPARILKMNYQPGGKEVFIYNKGHDKDAIILELRGG